MKNYIYRKKSLAMTSLNIVFDVGSRNEVDGERGTMHLMEHLVCKTFKDMYGRLAELGIDWNAYTNSECVRVSFIGLDKYLTNELKSELYKRITGGIDFLGEDEFETEKNVVLQEYMDHIFDSDSASWMQVMRKWWGDYLTIGRKSDIEAFTYDDMKRVYAERFTAPARIVEVGRRKTELFETVRFKEIEKNQSRYRFGRRKGIEDVNVASDDKTPVFLFSKKRVTKSDYPYLFTGLMMLTDGLESPYYTELREKLGLTYYVWGDVLREHDNGVMVINACTDSENAERLKGKIGWLVEHTADYMTTERFDTVMSKIKIEREMNDAVLYKNPSRLVSISKMRMPNRLSSITFGKVVEATLKYMSDTVVVTHKD